MNDNVTVRQLRGFLAVARERSFTKAAVRMHLTQSALTASIKALEGELGLRLFDRTTRAVAPTAHGERFVPVAERLLEDMGRALDDLRAYAERRQGQVVIAATATVINDLLVPALGRLSEQYPGIRIRLIEELTEGAIRRLQSSEIDLAFTTLEGDVADIEALPMFRDRFELVCAAGHSLATIRKSQRWRVFLEDATVGLTRQSGLFALLDRHPAGQFAVRDMRYEVSSVAGLKAMIETGLGIAAVPGLMAREMAGPGVVRRPLTPAIWRTVSLAVRSGRSPTPAASAVVAAALGQLGDIREKTIEPLVDPDALMAAGFELR